MVAEMVKASSDQRGCGFLVQCVSKQLFLSGNHPPRFHSSFPTWGCQQGQCDSSLEIVLTSANAGVFLLPVSLLSIP